MDRKQLLCAMMALSMMASTTVPAFAEDEVGESPSQADSSTITADNENDNEHSSKVTLEVLDTGEHVIVATVPVELPIVMDVDGNIAVPTTARIVNQVKTKGIKVSSIDVKMADGWSSAEFSDDFSSKEKDSKILGLSLRDDTLGSDGSFSLTEENWKISKNSELPLNMKAKLPLQSEQEKSEIATIGFTLDWSGDNASLVHENASNGLSMTEEEATAAGYTWKVVSAEDKTIALTAYNNNQATIVNIPEKIGENTVVSIADDDLFCNNYRIRQVTMPDTIISVTVRSNRVSGDVSGLFSGCTNLESIVLSNGLQTIAPYMFYNCPNLNYVWLPTELTKIGSHAFFKNSALTEISFPDSLTTIDSCAFEDCSNLTQIKLPDKVKEIGGYAFEGCSSLTTIKIPGTIQNWYVYSFKDCTNLVQVEIEEGCLLIPGYAFYGCTKLKTVSLPESLQRIGYSSFGSSGEQYAFYNCKSLKEITIPNNTTTIYGSSFSGCDGITFNIQNKEGSISSTPPWSATNATINWLG